MKKKILIISLAVNLVAGSVFLYAFTPKAKTTNERGDGFVCLRLVESNGGMMGGGTYLTSSDGIKVDRDDKVGSKGSEINMNVTKKMNELKEKGYDLISSNGCADQYGRIITYVFAKK